MKARFVTDCLYCKKVRKAIKIGEEIIPHPHVKGAWVHKDHLSKDKQVQLKLF